MIAMLWAQQIMLEKKTYAQVPRRLKDKVKEILVDSGMEELVTDAAEQEGSIDGSKNSSIYI